MKRFVFLILSLWVVGTALGQQKQDQIFFNDQIKTKVYYTTSYQHAYVILDGSATAPILGSVVWDQTYSASQLNYLKVLSLGGTRALVQAGLTGKSAFQVIAGRSLDTTVTPNVVFQANYDSVLVSIAGTEVARFQSQLLRLGGYQDFMNPNGTGDSVRVGYGAGVGDLYVSRPLRLGIMGSQTLFNSASTSGSLGWAQDTLLMKLGAAGTLIPLYLKNPVVGQVLKWDGSKISWGTDITGGGGGGNQNFFTVKAGATTSYPDTVLSFDGSVFSLSSGPAYQANIGISSSSVIAGSIFSPTLLQTDTIAGKTGLQVVLNSTLKYLQSSWTMLSPNGSRVYTFTTSNGIQTPTITFTNRSGSVISSPDLPAAGSVLYFDGTDWKQLSATGSRFLYMSGTTPTWADIYGMIGSWTANQSFNGVATFNAGASFNNGIPAFNTPTVPFTVVSSGKVSALNADLLDGFHASQTAVANFIPAAGANHYIDSGYVPPVSYAYHAFQADSATSLKSSTILSSTFFSGADTCDILIPGMTTTGAVLAQFTSATVPDGVVKDVICRSGKVTLVSSAVETKNILTTILILKYQ